MQAKVYKQKSSSMGDFYIYYNKAGKTVFSVCTADLSTPYIKNHRRFKNLKYNSETHAVVWSWQADRLLKIPLSDIKKLVPLATVLKNRVPG